ncbi:uncharacterized protein [Linepithema humile]|uniref:uncharacterized protein isoform X2 n=1 Tax=Linepithema humile TaxID=83485 RepID=UPI0006236D39|nr:PREDICTED: uncharacterized protein LOC105676796 isoform X2 [Linepithema humile]
MTNKNDDVMNEISSSFKNKEDMIALLKALFVHGYSDHPFDILPGMSTEEQHAAISSTFQRIENAVKDRPLMVNWLQSKLFEDNDCKVPLALLFIQLYEERSSLDQEKTKCNFREIYHFLYKITMNQLPPRLSQKSAKILHRLLSEIIEEVWPNAQRELVNYLTKVQSFNRPGMRKVYSRKRMALKRCTAKYLFQI